jgi:hypothetical protein
MPVAPTVTSVQPTCAVATGSITVTAPTGTGVTCSIDGTSYQASATFSGLVAGTYSVTAKNAAGCISTATSVTINAAPATPTAPVVTSVQPTCAVATGSITVSSPVQGLTYSINGTSYQASATFAGLVAGTYSVTAKNATGCISTATSVTINAAPATPVAPTVTSVQPTCAVATGSITVSNPVQGLTYSINGTSYQASATFAGLVAGTYSVTAKNVAGCISSATSVTINTAPATPTAPVVTSVQPTCAVATGSITVSNPVQGLTYSINGTSYQASATFAGLVAGTYSVTAKNAAGCISSATSVTINTAPAMPTAPVVTSVQPTCAVATGSITVSSPVQGLTYSINGTSYQASATFAGLVAGTYSVTAKNAAGCISTATSVTINVAPATPTAPVVTSVQPTCAVATGSITLTNPVQGLTYSINGTSYQASATFTGLVAGTYSVTAKNAAGCISTATSVIINAAPATPTAPVVTSVQPTCAVATGSITVSSPVQGLTYSINGTSYQASATFTGLVAGTYSVTAKNAAGCISTVTSVTINAAPATPVAPTVTSVQPTCAVATGTITVSSPVQGFTYSINGTDYQASAVFNNVVPGSYEVVAKNAEGCISQATLVNINVAPNAPAIPTTTVTQPTCLVATGTISVNNAAEGLEYSLDQGEYQTSATFNDVAPGTYTITVRNSAGCVTSNTVTVEVMTAPEGPIASAQTFCTGATVAELTANGSNLQWYADATTTTPLASTVVLSTGIYYVSQIVGQCESARTSVSVTINSLPVVAPVSDIISCGSYVLPQLAVGDYYTMPAGEGTLIPAGTSLTTSQTIYVYATNNCGGAGESFTVTILTSPVIAPVTNVEVCQSYTLPALIVGNYFTAPNGQGTELQPGDLITQNTEVYIYASNGDVIECTSEVSFTVTINTTSPATASAQIFCGNTTVANLEAEGDNIQWYASADATEPLASTTALETGVYFVTQTVNGCESTRTWVDVLVNITAAPTGESTQVISAETAPDATIEDIIVLGDNIQWYASPEAVEAGTPLAQGTELVNGTTYYATQTVNGCESSFLAVTVEVVLKTDGKDSIKFTYYPNPVKDRLNIISGSNINLVEVYTLQGQKVISQGWNATTGQLNMSQLEEANYLVRVYSENNTQSFMVTKGH